LQAWRSIDAAAARDDLLGPVDVIGEVRALFRTRVGVDARADIADLVGDLDEFSVRRLVRSVLDLLLPTLRFGKRHVVGHLHNQRSDTLAEFFRELLARGGSVLDRVMQPTGRDEFGVDAVSDLSEDVCDFGQMIDVRLVAPPLPRHAIVPARREIGGFGDEAQAGKHCVTACP
jgi:hypothetical protein